MSSRWFYSLTRRSKLVGNDLSEMISDKFRSFEATRWHRNCCGEAAICGHWKTWWRCPHNIARREEAELPQAAAPTTTMLSQWANASSLTESRTRTLSELKIHHYTKLVHLKIDTVQRCFHSDEILWKTRTTVMVYNEWEELMMNIDDLLRWQDFTDEMLHNEWILLL